MIGLRGVDGGAGVDAREELAVLELFPFTPFVVLEVGAIGAGRLTPHDVVGLGIDLGLPRDGKSPSERMLGGVEGFRGRLMDDGMDVSVWESASN